MCRPRLRCEFRSSSMLFCSSSGAAQNESHAASDSAEDSDWELADEKSEKEAAKNQAQQNKDANCRTLTRLVAEEFVELMPQHLSPEQFQEFQELRRSHEECWWLKGQEIRKRWELKEREE